MLSVFFVQRETHKIIIAPREEWPEVYSQRGYEKEIIEITIYTLILTSQRLFHSRHLVYQENWSY